MITNFRPFDENGHMKHSGRACAAKRGVVASGRAEASEIGKEILAAGGNAVDAAVAVAFALGVCEPNACGIGGGGFFLIRSAKTGENVFLNFREKAPAAARPDMYERNPTWDPSKGWEGANYEKICATSIPQPRQPCPATWPACSMRWSITARWTAGP